MISKMSEDDEKRLLDAFDGMQSLVAAGDTPNDAAVKVARDLGVPIGHVPLLARVYNTQAGNEARRAGSTLLAKAAAVAVADSDTIVAALEAEAPAAKAAALRDDFAHGPSWYRPEPVDDGPPMRKSASPLLGAYDAAVTYREEFDGPRHLTDRYRTLERARDEAADAFDAAMVAEERFRAGLSKVAAALADYREPALVDVRDNAADVLGPDAVTVLDHVAARQPELAKHASRDPHHAVDRRRGVYGAVVAAIELGRDAVAAGAANVKAAAAFKAAEAAAAPKIDRPEVAPTSLLSKRAAGPFTTSLGVALSRDAVQGAMDRLGVPAQEKRVDRAYSTLTNPTHEQELEDIHTRAMLADLMANDEVIAAHDPHEVARSFNQLSRLAPRVSRQPLLMESLLRQTLQQGAMAHYDSDQILSTEQKLRDTSGTHPFLAKPNKGVSNGPKPFG